MNDMKKTQRSDPVLLVKDRVARILLAIDIGSSSVRCSAYTFGSARDSSSGANDEESGPVSPVLVPGCAIKIKSKIVGDHCGRADARQVVQLADQALDDCISALRGLDLSHAVCAVGFACFGMNLVGVGADGNPCTPVYTYANSESNSNTAESITNRLKKSLERSGLNGKGGVEEACQRTGTPCTHGSYAAVQLLKLCVEQPSVARSVKVWQTLPSLLAARWCCLSSAPISFSEASWTGLFNFRVLEWDAPILAVLQEEGGFDPSTLPTLACVGGLRARASGQALKRWPELKGASIRLGLGDGAAACLGSGCDVGSGLLSVTVGTSSAARVVARAIPRSGRTAAATAGDDFRVPKGLWCYRLDRNRAVLGGSLTDGGSVFEWMQNALGLLDCDGGMSSDGSKTVMREAEEMAPASHGLTVLPFFSGERSPGYNENATACILGLRRSTTRAQILRAGLESVCLRLAAVVELMSGAVGSGDTNREALDGQTGDIAATALGDEGLRGVRISPRRTQVDGAGAAEGAPPTVTSIAGLVASDARVVTSGAGMAASPLWQQILADCLGRTVLQDSRETEQTSLGVAVMMASLEQQNSTSDDRLGDGGGEGEGDGDGVAGGGRGESDGGGLKRENAWGFIVRKPNEGAFRRYASARQMQERAYRAIIGGEGGGGGLL